VTEGRDARRTRLRAQEDVCEAGAASCLEGAYRPNSRMEIVNTMRGSTLLITLCLLTCVSTLASAQDCTTIQSGLIVDSAGNPISTGYDQWGYNYQAHMFNGIYWNYSRPTPPYTDDTAPDNTTLQMKWNDAWLSNQDCDGDGELDRYYGFDSYIGSGAWLTNHQSGSYDLTVNGKVKKYHWTYFVKIVAVPADATAAGGFWYDADGVEIGPVIWGAFAIVQEVYNDPMVGVHGKQYLSPSGPGFGTYAPGHGSD
jgi:hypothetical protein